MDVDPSDFLAPSRRARTSHRGDSSPFLRYGALLLPLVGLIPLGIALLRSHPPQGQPATSFSQKLQQEQSAPASEDPNRSAPAPSSPGDSASPAQDPAPVPDSPVAQTEPTPPSPAATTPPAEIRKDVEHRVRNGETLSALALRYGVASADIVAANQLQAQDRILVGQILTIPNVPEEKARALAASQAASKTAATASNSAKKSPKTPPATTEPTRRGPVVVGAPAPAPKGATIPMPVAGLPAPVDGDAAQRTRVVVVGAPVPPEKLPPSSTRPASPGSAQTSPPSHLSQTSRSMGPTMALKRYPDQADYLVQPIPQRETVTTSSLELAPNGATLPREPNRFAQDSVMASPGGSGFISYLVQPFDTLSSVASAHATTPEIICSLNHIEKLQVGQTILLPISHNQLAAPAATR